MPLGSNTSGHLFDTTFTTNGPLYSAASGVVTSAAAGSAGQVLQAGSPPVFSTATYPSTAGSSGNILTSNGTNWTSAAPASSGFTSVVEQWFNADGTYTPTSGMKYCIVEVVGGGGGGGGANATGAGQVSVGGGGGGGGYNFGVFSAATIGANQSITIGTAGTAGTNTGGTGGTGGTTSFGALLTAGGGVGGGGGSSVGASAASLGGNAGSGVSPVGSMLLIGTAGGNGVASNAGVFAYGGAGGSSYFGAGGKGSAIISSKQGGSTPSACGGGGGGSAAMASQGTGIAGGAGGVGIVRITEFI